ncbi:hypothetical protein KUCAC02_033649 [Chaenocephalus aceratus]|nr:hypothetical protein KUCAC02_033649 [Chaenocephalus aceratus]
MLWRCDLTTHATAFVINARSKHRLSQKGMNDIVAGVQQYQSSLLDNLRTQMKEVLKKIQERKFQLLEPYAGRNVENQQILSSKTNYFIMYH